MLSTENVWNRRNTLDEIISDRAYNLTIGAVLLWGFALNALMVKHIDPAPIVQFMGGSPWIFMGMYFASIVVGTMIFTKSDNPAVSFLGYNFLVLPLGLVLVAAGVQDPGNVGALVRVGAGLGAVGLVFLQGSASPWHPRAVRGASGTTFRLPLVETVTAADLIAAAARQELPLWTTAADGRPYTTVAPQACVLILGEEGRGVPAELESAASERLGIPLQRGVESLNVATAAAVLVAALARPGGEA